MATPSTAAQCQHSCAAPALEINCTQLLGWADKLAAKTLSQAPRRAVSSYPILLCRHVKHRQDKVTQELTSSATPPAPIDIEELNKVGKHAEVSTFLQPVCRPS